MAFLFVILFDLTLAIGVMTGVWIYLNRDDEQVLEMKKIIEDLSSDLSNILKKIKFLLRLISDIIEPFLSLQVVDIESKTLNCELDEEV